MEPHPFESGDIVRSFELDGELWELDTKLPDRAWGASNETGDVVLSPGTFRHATEKEKERFKPSRIGNTLDPASLRQASQVLAFLRELEAEH